MFGVIILCGEDDHTLNARRMLRVSCLYTDIDQYINLAKKKRLALQKKTKKPPACSRSASGNSSASDAEVLDMQLKV